ncbi:MAG: hypothetical protein M1833_006929 [Piccolia ochrophora]|nr:MAG: hypothetical protein M1833_006929 [Piccolia ochrophora]
MNPNFSPADSMLSVPSECLPSLFDTEDCSSPAATALTPQSFDDDDSEREDSRPPQDGDSDKKPVKKRKSWGQELPTPKTNLPPRKRAKTEDEKEQRRIERVLRNRAAAQSSRERKRKEVEGLEEEKQHIVRQNSMLAGRLREVEMENHKLSETIAKMAAEMTVFRKVMNGDLSTPHTSKQTSPTLSTDLYSNNDPVPHLKQEYEDLDFVLPPPQSTVDPRDADFISPSGSPKVGPTSTTTPNLTQHPAEMLCDLQCQLGDVRMPWGLASTSTMEESTRQQQAFLTLLTTLSHLLLATMVSTASSLLLSPLAQIFHSLKTGSPLSVPAEPVEQERFFRLIRWLTSTPINPLTTATTTSTPSTHPLPSRSTFRTRLLRRLLACSPALARPLRDATGKALQLKSSGELARTSRPEAEDGVEDVAAGGGGTTGDVPSLLTMLWAIEKIEKARGKEEKTRSDPAADIRRLCVTLDNLFGGDGGNNNNVAGVHHRSVKSLSGGSIRPGLGLSEEERTDHSSSSSSSPPASGRSGLI